ncbi:MAG: FYDLN acid domain-containing protein [Rhodobacteraceae bacterium]|nr:FYDLN acid domain-containing protein [Paracoccaceae bacterium]
MAKPDWGKKHVCEECGTRFYDLMRDPAECPACGLAIKVESPEAAAHDPDGDSQSPPTGVADADDDVGVIEEDDPAGDLDDVLDESDEDSVSLDELANVAADEEN